MNLRISLILVIVLAWASVGAAWYVKSGTGEDDEPTPPFFYTLSTEDMRTITIATEDDSITWEYDLETRRWWFGDLEDIPTNLKRWGGITTLLGGPRTQRVVQDSVDTPEIFGLDDPELIISVGLRDGGDVTLRMGDTTPDGGAHYSQIDGYPQLVTVDSSWGQVLKRLVDEPPLPDWWYNLDPATVTEILLFEENEITSAYGVDDDIGWIVCDVPIDGTPCEGTELADSERIVSALEHFANRSIVGAESLNVPLEDDRHEEFGTTQNAPYVSLRVEKKRPDTNITEATIVTMIIGDCATAACDERYAVGNETADIIRVDSEWAAGVLDWFEDDFSLPGS